MKNSILSFEHENSHVFCWYNLDTANICHLTKIRTFACRNDCGFFITNLVIWYSQQSFYLLLYCRRQLSQIFCVLCVFCIHQLITINSYLNDRDIMKILSIA